MRAFLKRWWWVLLLIAVALGFWRLRFDVDVLDLLPSDEPSVEGLKLYERHFTKAGELLITLRAADADQAQNVAQKLAATLRSRTNLVREVTWQPPWMEHPEQLGELLGWLWFNQEPATFADLKNRLAPENLTNVLEQTKEALATSMSPMDLGRLEYDPYNLMSLPAISSVANFSSGQNQQMFASADGKFRVLYVESAIDLSGYRACESWLNAIHGIVDQARGATASVQNSDVSWKNVQLRFTGRPVFVMEIATSMQNDMSHSVGATSTIIAILFYLMHRRLRPMLWLLTLLMLILMSTLALGGLVLGSINVVSMGFAAVLLGLAVDYAVVHYQEALAHPDMTVPEIRRAIAPSILWAAITTMSAFLVLNFGGLPGLGQLGTLVAIGIGLSAWVMVMIYLPPLFRDRRAPRPNQPKFHLWHYFVAPHEPPVTGTTTAFSGGTALLVTGAVMLGAMVILCFRIPGLDRTANALHPQHSPAQIALDEMTVELGLPPQPLWLIVSGQDETDVYDRLVKAQKLLDEARTNEIVGQFLLPVAFWPRSEFQQGNRQTAAALGRKGSLLASAALNAGFKTNATLLADEVVHEWQRDGESSAIVWPTNSLSQWLLSRFITRTTNQILVVGLVYPPPKPPEMPAIADLSRRLSQNGALLSSWDLLGSTTLKRVESKMWRLITPMVILVLASLWFAFRRPTEILLGAAVLCLSGFCLLATMALAGWTWNLMNLMAAPLILGTGVDYTIFIQLALRRHGGDLAAVRRSVGRALMLCGATAVTGFGSLGMSSNPGMASLGRVCAVGIGANMLISVFLLPAWWLVIRRFQKSRKNDA
ncbi:MAG TPA: MMPL family transporter [Verrucomicrobiae bacterium]|nr:MMPL family transporter [Verrucomicrobiae bacterium]